MAAMPRATVVTAYYRFPSKHSYEEYDAWMTTFLETVASPMVIFTDADMAERVWARRPAALRPTTRLELLPLADFAYAQEPYASYWVRDWHRDPERGYHSPLLYLMWNEKTNLVARVLRANPFQTEFFAWCDIGMMRAPAASQRRYVGCPEPAALAALRTDQIYLLNIEPFQPGEGDLHPPHGLTAPFLQKNRVGGGVLLGGAAAWERWIPAFDATLRLYMAADYFAGKDQSVMATTAFRHPDLVSFVRPTPYVLADGSPGDPWFYMLRRFILPPPCETPPDASCEAAR